MTIEDSVRAEIEAMPAQVRSSGLASTALVVASRLVDAGHRDTAPLARELRAALAELRELAAAVPAEVDPLDELERKRAARLAKVEAPKRTRVSKSAVSKRAASADNGGPRSGRSRGQRRADSGSGTS